MFAHVGTGAKGAGMDQRKLTLMMFWAKEDVGTIILC